MKKLFLIMACAFMTTNLMAQTNTVVVKLQMPNGSPAENVSLLSKKAKGSAKSDANGLANIDIAIKDELVISDPKFYEVSISLKNWNPADTINVPMTPIEGTTASAGNNASDGATAIGKYTKYGNIYEAIKGTYPMLRVYSNGCVVSNRAIDDSECALVVVDGRPNANLDEVGLSEVTKIEFLQASQAAMYGTDAKFGALIITIGNSNRAIHR